MCAIFNGPGIVVPFAWQWTRQLGYPRVQAESKGIRGGCYGAEIVKYGKTRLREQIYRCKSCGKKSIHTDQVLREYAGASDDEIASWREDGVL